MNPVDDGSIFHHIPAALLGGLITGAITLFVFFARRLYQAGRKEEAVDALSEQRIKAEAETVAMWRRVDELNRDLQDARTQLAVLKAKVEAMPDHSELHDALSKLEAKLESKLNGLAVELRDILVNAGREWRCPMQPRD